MSPFRGAISGPGPEKVLSWSPGSSTATFQEETNESLATPGGASSSFWVTSLRHTKTTNGKRRETPWIRACKAARVRRFRSHGIRRLVSNEWIRSGVNVAVYARAIGHSPEEALRAYSSILGSDELAAFERVASPPPDNVEPLK